MCAAREKIVIVIVCVLSFSLVFFFQKDNVNGVGDSGGKDEIVVRYVRPNWANSNVTNVVHKPIRPAILVNQPNLDWSKVCLPEKCRVSVPAGVSTNPLLADMYQTISNAIEIADQILSNKQYAVHCFSRSTTLVWKDEERNGLWYIHPSSRNNHISSIRFMRYEDEQFSMLNVAESYDISFNKDGDLDIFRSWDSSAHLSCKHRDWGERPYYISYGIKISPHCTKIMRYNKEGQLVEEKVEDSRNFPPPF